MLTFAAVSVDRARASFEPSTAFLAEAVTSYEQAEQTFDRAGSSDDFGSRGRFWSTAS